MALAPFFLLEIFYNPIINISIAHLYLKIPRKVSDISYIIIKQ
jgi:hypothetical protein